MENVHALRTPLPLAETEVGTSRQIDHCFPRVPPIPSKSRNPTMNSLILRAVSMGLLLCTASARADLVIPGADGSDGALNITTNTVIDLSQAVTAAWDANNAANAGKGVYDFNKWAVVFKYSSVTVNAGATVTFKNHPSRAPVVWLVGGDVIINGTVNLDGASHANAPGLASPGPGGFRGGVGRYDTGVGSGSGFGPGGGARLSGGSFGTVGDSGSIRYGNPSLVPLLGGSGGGGDNETENDWHGGGAGAGGLLIGASGKIAIGGLICAKGGAGENTTHSGWNAARSGGGSGGSIRLVSASLAGWGRVEALGGGGYRPGGLGRIRIERVINDNSLTVVPSPSVVDLPDGATALLWPPAGAPEVRIVSIQGKDVPADPRAEFGTIGADVTLPRTGAVLVVVETHNVERASEMKIRGTPRVNGDYKEVNGVVDSVVSESPLVIRWKAELPVQDGYAAVQVKVVRP